MFLTVIYLISPIEMLMPVPLYLAARFGIKDDTTRIKGCIVSFLVWLLLSQVPVIPISLLFTTSIYLTPGTTELAILIGGGMLLDILRQKSSTN